jgi:hypothetical protein
MNPSRLLRIAVIAEIALIPVGVALSFWADSFLPKDVLTFKESQANPFMDVLSGAPGMIALMVGVLAMCGAWIASIIGLLKLKRWGAWLYLFITLSALPMYYMTGFDIRHPIDQLFDDIYRVIPGFILGLAFFSDAIPRKDSEQTVLPNGMG